MTKNKMGRKKNNSRPALAISLISAMMTMTTTMVTPIMMTMMTMMTIMVGTLAAPVPASPLRR